MCLMSETKTDTKTTANYEALDARLSQPPQEIENPKACFANFLRKIKREPPEEPYARIEDDVKGTPL